jgi:mono/diheme cytochrome c family protein
MSMRLVQVSAAAIAALVACVGEPGSALAASAENGKTAFIHNGCWQCHDYNGQGSVATSNGKVIARTQLPLDAFVSFVRTTNGQMPPYRAPVLSDADLGDIYTYLQSLPEPKAASDIPLLNSVRAQ